MLICGHSCPPPTPRSCPLWFSSALWCPCCTTSDWCSGSLERYRDYKEVGDRGRADHIRVKVLNVFYLDFYKMSFPSYRDPFLPQGIRFKPKLLHGSTEGILSPGLLITLWLEIPWTSSGNLSSYYFSQRIDFKKSGPDSPSIPTIHPCLTQSHCLPSDNNPNDSPLGVARESKKERKAALLSWGGFVSMQKFFFRSEKFISVQLPPTTVSPTSCYITKLS